MSFSAKLLAIQRKRSALTKDTTINPLLRNIALAELDVEATRLLQEAQETAEQTRKQTSLDLEPTPPPPAAKTRR